MLVPVLMETVPINGLNVRLPKAVVGLSDDIHLDFYFFRFPVWFTCFVLVG